MQASTSSHTRKEAKDAQDWEIVPTDCSWRMPYKAGVWAFSGPEDPAGSAKSPNRQFRGSLFQKSSSLRLTAWKGRSSSKEARCDSDTSLNLELAGIQGALDSLVSYERAVGFHYEAFPNIEPRELDTFSPSDLSSRGLEEEVTQTHKEQWNELLEDLMRAPLAETPDTDESSDMDGADVLHYSTSTLASMDLSSSEGSIESLGMPATPKAKSHHRVEIKSGSPTGSIIGSEYHSLSPGRLLNASASSFVPGFPSHFTITEESLQFSPSQDTSTSAPNPKSPSFTNFTFPTLNPSASLAASVQAVRSKKDNPGLFAEDSASPTPTLLPPFLQEPAQRSSRSRKSRTREIVDRLRSEASPNDESGSTPSNLRAAVSPNYASYSPSPLPALDDSDSVIQPRRTVSEDGNDHQHRPSISTTSFSASVSVSASVSASASTSGLSTPDAVEEDDDGWINVARPVSASSAALLAASTSPTHLKEDKSKRTRELFLALTKRRTDSLSSEQWREIVHNAGAKVDSEDVSSLEASISSLPSPPKTPPSKHPELSGWNQGSPPNPGPYMNGWVESSPVGSPEANLPPTPKSQKEKTPRKEGHHRKKSSAHNFNQVNHIHSHSNSTWTRGPSTGPHVPLAHLQHHPHPHVHLQQHPHAHLHVHQQHQHQHVPMGQFPPTTSPGYTTQPMMTHPSANPTVAPGPYFFPAYQTVGVGMPVGMAVPVGASLAVSPIAYQPAQYGVMQPAHSYPMVVPPVAGVYANSSSALPGGYSHMRVNPGKPPTAAGINANVASMPMPVPVGAGYAGMGATRGKGTW